MTRLFNLLAIFLLTSCSLFGIQSEESPKYKILEKQGDFEIREYKSYLIAKTTVKGDFDDASSKAFRKLAGYIFGKNKSKQKIAMTSPVEMKEESEKIAMTSPVIMNRDKGSFTMAFSLPSKFTLDNLPEPLDKDIIFEVVKPHIIASHQFSWFRTESRIISKVNELREWLKKHPNYKADLKHSYAGYNPPWTIPFLRRNEVHIKLN